MSQYERIVSYIYQYDHDVKGTNTGFARVEQRGNRCRIFAQIRSFPTENLPRIYFYRQQATGIETVEIGKMAVRGNNFICKADSEAERLFYSGYSVDDMDGLFIYVAQGLYFVTSWKRDSFFIGAWEADRKSRGQERLEAASESEESIYGASGAQNAEKLQPAGAVMPAPGAEVKHGSEEIQFEWLPETDGGNPAQQPAGTEQGKPVENQGRACSRGVPQPEKPAGNTDRAGDRGILRPEKPAGNADRAGGRGALQQPAGGAHTESLAKEEKIADIQMQSICGVCPFKRNTYDFGKKILLSFPSMKPFQEGVVKECVRMELQDIGCLPIQFWSLSGNRFLLHGYYCYRHLIFAKAEEGKYLLGVPGIFSEKERRNAARFGFYDFRAIGEGGSSQGAFGYWFMELPKAAAQPDATSVR